MRKFLAKIILFLSQFCDKEIVLETNKTIQQDQSNFDVDEFLSHIENKEGTKGDFEFLKEVDPAVYIIFGVDNEGNQFVDINWKDEHPEVVKFLVSALISLGTGNPASLIVDSLRNNADGTSKKCETIKETLAYLESVIPKGSMNIKDNPVMSPLDVFNHTEGQ